MQYTSIGFILGAITTATLAGTLINGEHSGVCGIVTGILICITIYFCVDESNN